MPIGSVLALVTSVSSFSLGKSYRGFINFISFLKKAHFSFTTPLYRILSSILLILLLHFYFISFTLLSLGLICYHSFVNFLRWVLIFHLSFFLIYAFKAIRFPLNTALDASVFFPSLNYFVLNSDFTKCQMYKM